MMMMLIIIKIITTIIIIVMVKKPNGRIESGTQKHYVHIYYYSQARLLRGSEFFP